MRTAIIDLDRTLVDRDAAFGRWADRLFDASARPVVDELDARFPERGRFFGELVAVLGLDADPAALWAEYRALMPELVAAFPGVREGLAGLREQGWRLAVLSNGQADNQMEKLVRTDLMDYFAACRFSGSTGLRKPAPAAFVDALQALGAAPGPGVWMVGDDPRLDVAGAGAVGLSTLWIGHGRPEVVPATISVSTPAEALRRLGRTG